MAKTKIIVTGGAGFIGSHLVNFLVKKKFEILVIDNLSNRNKIDIRDNKKINNCFKEFSPDYVFHLAAITSKSLTNAKEVKEVNVLGTTNILKACIKNNVKKIIFSSSAAVYGNAEKFPIKENQKLSPINPYGISKADAEQNILSYSKKYNLNYSILRYSNVYGPGQRSDSEGGVVSIFSNNIFLSKKIIVYGNGAQTRDFIYIDDVIRANYLSMLSPANFIANVSTGNETSVLNLIKIIEKKLDKKANIIYKPAKEGEIERSCLDNSLIKRKIKWKPKRKITN